MMGGLMGFQKVCAPLFFPGSILSVVPSNGVGMKTKTLPFKIKIASPCPARWEDMGGDDRVRFCDHCRKNVYNISALTTAEAVSLLESKKGNLCARIYQRVDGTVLTEDCPVGMARHWRRLKIMTSSGIAVILLTIVNLSAFGRDGDKTSANNRPCGRFVIAAQGVLSNLAKRLDLFSKPGMGKIRVALPPKQLPAPLMGIVAMPAPATPPPAKK